MRLLRTALAVCALFSTVNIASSATQPAQIETQAAAPSCIFRLGYEEIYVGVINHPTAAACKDAWVSYNTHMEFYYWSQDPNFWPPIVGVEPSCTGEVVGWVILRRPSDGALSRSGVGGVCSRYQ